MNGMLNYVGGNTKCAWMSQDMTVEDILKLVEQAMGVSVREVKMWYSMKFDRRMMVPFQDNGDVVSMMRGNDGHGYLYVVRWEDRLVGVRWIMSKQKWLMVKQMMMG